MNLELWAQRWGVPVEALEDLRRVMGIIDRADQPEGDLEPLREAFGAESVAEADVQTRIRLEASAAGARLWRNNVGAGKLSNGSFVRWGLCNESERMNRYLKSSDQIGIRPVLIQPKHVGHVIGQFLAREVKRTDWVWGNSERENAQLRYLELVTSMGGDAAFARGVGTI